jgi:preprotein translocase subunit Sec61beta
MEEANSRVPETGRLELMTGMALGLTRFYSMEENETQIQPLIVSTCGAGLLWFGLPDCHVRWDIDCI